MSIKTDYILYPKNHIKNSKPDPSAEYFIAAEQTVDGRVEYASYRVEVVDLENGASVGKISNFSDRTLLTPDFVQKNFHEQEKCSVVEDILDNDEVLTAYYYIFS